MGKLRPSHVDVGNIGWGSIALILIGCAFPPLFLFIIPIILIGGNPIAVGILVFIPLAIIAALAPILLIYFSFVPPDLSTFDFSFFMLTLVCITLADIVIWAKFLGKKYGKNSKKAICLPSAVSIFLALICIVPPILSEVDYQRKLKSNLDACSEYNIQLFEEAGFSDVNISMKVVDATYERYEWQTYSIKNIVITIDASFDGDLSDYSGVIQLLRRVRSPRPEFYKDGRIYVVDSKSTITINGDVYKVYYDTKSKLYINDEFVAEI